MNEKLPLPNIFLGQIFQGYFFKVRKKLQKYMIAKIKKNAYDSQPFLGNQWFERKNFW